MTDNNDWAIADRISDGIVNLVNAELAEMRRTDTIDPLQLLVGQCLGLMALLRTAPLANPPQVLILLETALNLCTSAAKEQRQKNPPSGSPGGDEM